MRRALTRNAKGEHELAYYLCAAPAATTDQELIRVAGSRWAIEECFQKAKSETGLDHYQVRRYDAWYRHITLAMLAHAYLSVTAATAPKALAAASSAFTLGEVRRLLAHLITTPPGRATIWAWSRWRSTPPAPRQNQPLPAKTHPIQRSAAGVPTAAALCNSAAALEPWPGGAGLVMSDRPRSAQVAVLVEAGLSRRG